MNKGVKNVLSDKYQDWYASQISKQLERGVDPFNLKVYVTVTKLKPLHAGWEWIVTRRYN